MPQSRSARRSRPLILTGAALAILALLAWAFWPRPVLVDMAMARTGAIQMTVDEEARTRVRDAYVVSAPIAGRLLRVDVEAGDEVKAGDSVLARMVPAPPSAIDVRTREQALAGIRAAEAGVRVARADLASAQAEQDLAASALERVRTLHASGTASEAALDEAERQKRAADAAVNTARAAISMRQAELANARARLIEFSEAPAPTGPAGGNGAASDTLRTIPLAAPISGQVLRVMQESETPVPAGHPILEIGDVSNDLEVVAELLSTDAVRVEAGDRVLIDHWGGETPLEGRVERVEPWGFTKYSALGVEEQRVNVIIRFDGPRKTRDRLGHGYRVEARIVVWSDEEALIVPSSALFRTESGWALFRVENGRARQVAVEVARNNGQDAALVSGVTAGDRLVLFPGPGVADGVRVRARDAAGNR